jgi:uncharacterized protein (TIGR00730 family)
VVAVCAAGTIPETSAMKSVCVFCGSNTGARPAYVAAARAMALTLVRRGLTLVYGGASRGLMGELADAALAAGGRVVGVMPRRLGEREILHHGLTELLVVESLAERKREMFERADAFVTLPGGFGTLDELAEVLTMSQLGLHAKPCGLLDVAGFFAPLREFLDGAVAERFLRPEHRALLISDEDPDRLLDRLAETPPALGDKWL